jgi:hypothetical protein
MPEWAPGVLEGLLAKIGTTGEANLRAGLLKIAAAIEAKAKADLALSSHPYGTPSPASKGGPPSLVSGTGRRSIGHQATVQGIEQVVKVGTLAGVYPPRRGKTSTPSSKYLLYQETLSRFDHPFLVPAYRHVVATEGVGIWLSAFRTWPRI